MYVHYGVEDSAEDVEGVLGDCGGGLMVGEGRGGEGGLERGAGDTES